jgi:DNA-binding MarR family transcriptional regulator
MSVTEARPPLGPALRRAWVGYQRRLDEALARAGFEGRRLPDGRVLRICVENPGTTIAAIGRELGISRQGAAKIVNSLRDRGYLTVAPSPTSGREKVVTITPRARDFLRARRNAARAIERQLRSQLGPDAFAALDTLLDALGAHEETRLRDYLREAGVREV